MRRRMCVGSVCVSVCERQSPANYGSIPLETSLDTQFAAYIQSR